MSDSSFFVADFVIIGSAEEETANNNDDDVRWREGIRGGDDGSKTFHDDDVDATLLFAA